MRKRIDIDEILSRLSRRDWTILGRAISIVENYEEGREAILDYAYRTAGERDQEPLVIGLTGAGGAGKSTLCD